MTSSAQPIHFAARRTDFPRLRATRVLIMPFAGLSLALILGRWHFFFRREVENHDWTTYWCGKLNNTNLTNEMVDYYWLLGIRMYTVYHNKQHCSILWRAWQIENWCCVLNKKYEKVRFWPLLADASSSDPRIYEQMKKASQSLFGKKGPERDDLVAERLASAGNTVGRIGFVSLWLIMYCRWYWNVF